MIFAPICFILDGTPIDVQQTTHATEEEINKVQQKIIAQLEELFEKYKYSYLNDPENARLEFL